MRMFYIFNIKSSIYNLYRDNPANLYKILESIYFMHLEDANYGFNLFQQLTNKFEITKLSNEIFIKLHRDMVYSKIGDEHIINDLYHDEVSILKIKASRILLESNKSYSSFFQILNEINNHYFVCDFKEKDFFFLGELENMIKQK